MQTNMEPLIHQATAYDILDPPAMVSVKAPAALPEGYVFQASVQVQSNSGNESEQREIQVKVPAGGVTKGQSMLVPFTSTADGAVIVAPAGEWKDGILDCCNLGIFHPSLLCGFFCPQPGMGQIMQRMNLNILGSNGTKKNTKDTFKIMVVLFILYSGVQTMNLYLRKPSTDGVDDDIAYDIDTLSNFKNVSPLVIAGISVALLFVLYFFIVQLRTRKAVRTHYSIPEGVCGEDVCYTLLCSCCSLSQMLRHTGQYEKYDGVCCSERGLPKEAPLNIV